MLTRLQKIYFGMARLGPSIMLDMLDLASTLFYFSIQALPAFYTGISIAMSYISIMVAEVIFGNLSDRTPTKRWGRRKPYVMVGAPLMALSFLFIFTPSLFLAEGDVFGLFIYSLVTMSLFKLFYGMTMTPFQSWMPELTEAPERPEVSQWQNVANFIGFVIGTFGTTLLAIEVIEWGLPAEILVMILAFVMIQLIGFIAPLKGLQKEGKYISSPNIGKELRSTLKNRNFIGWMVAQGLLAVAITMIFRSTFPFIDDYLQFSTMEFIIFGIELLSVVFVFFLIWRWLIRQRGKRITLQVAMLVAALSLPLTLIATDATLGFVMIALVGAGVSGYYLMPYIVFADFAHRDEILTGSGRAGMYTSIPSIPLNTFQAIASFLWGIIFSLPATVIPASGGDPLSQGYIYWGPIASLFLLLSIIVLFKVDIDPDFDALKRQAGLTTSRPEVESVEETEMAED